MRKCGKAFNVDECKLTDVIGISDSGEFIKNSRWAEGFAPLGGA
jgi:hypothetical protein